MAPITVLTPSPTTAQTSAPSTTVRAKCANGIAGVKSGRYCCALECGSCGGSHCHERAAEADLTPEDCCVSLISESGVYCDDSGVAPCISGEGEEQIQTAIKLKGKPMATRENIPFYFHFLVIYSVR